MGRYAAHRIADLPPAVAAKVRRAMDVLYGDAPVTESEQAEAYAFLQAEAVESPQGAFDLAPSPLNDKYPRPRSNDGRNDSG
jgi:hypothetical protein